MKDLNIISIGVMMLANMIEAETLVSLIVKSLTGISILALLYFQYRKHKREEAIFNKEMKKYDNGN